ncbi:MAG: peptidoglycan DD-metalloendopeptidase family protein [Bacteroidetes bacterium]|nr:peptidoglycan DD-metalloendopeptidase family protein [Bacteroidota bacterium]
MKRYRILLVIGFLACSIIIFISLIRHQHRKNEKEKTVSVLPVREPSFKYGINVDSFTVVNGKVRPDQNLSVLLQSYHVTNSNIDLLAKLSQRVFDVRKIKAGNAYTVFCSHDTLEKAEYFIYEVSPTSYVVFDLLNKLNVYSGRKEVTTIVRSASGTIRSSLWNSIEEKGLNPSLAVELADIFAWTIDFFGIQKGDQYRVIYEEEIVEKDTIGIGRILSACFNHIGRDYFAFYFVQDGIGDYFDEMGNSVRREFLKAPLRYSRISSKYSRSRLHPILKIYRPHFGVDYSAPSGTPVYTIGDGTVIGAGYDSKGGGRYVRIKHNSVYTSLYMHLSGYARGLREGMRVQQGDLIGYVGRSGLATGPHLDFRIFKNGSPVNPIKVESPPAKPVDPSKRIGFDSVKVNFRNQLEEIVPSK